MKTLKRALVAACMMTTFATFAQDKVGGGGDGFESEVDEIRKDILAWVDGKGSKGLKLPEGMTLEDYETGMKTYLLPKAVTVSFIEKDHPRDPELQVQVDGYPKTCRSFIAMKDKKHHILCNISRFQKTPAEIRYRLIHHEYAVTAGLEKNDGAASDYEISNQITSYLEPRMVQRLALKKVGACRKVLRDELGIVGYHLDFVSRSARTAIRSVLN